MRETNREQIAGADRRHVRVGIIGAGFAGIGMAVRLRQAGHDDFIIFEQLHDVGGTWLVNSYPGCACDIPSHLYSFSFEPNPDWSRMFPPQEEIWRYLRRVADKYRLGERTLFGTEVLGCRYDEATARWHLQLSSGVSYTCDVLIAGLGALNRPALPALPGLAEFAGVMFHSQQWNHDYDLAGKRVAVIGTGASAIQFVPQIAGRVTSLGLFQRTPPWIIPRPDRAIGRLERALYRRLPWLQRLYRGSIYSRLEWRFIPFTRFPGVLRLMQRLATRHLRKQVPDEALRARLTPHYTIGCKRVLLSSDYYPALGEPQVELVTTGIERVVADGIVTVDGAHRRFDAIILGTGFRATNPLPRGLIEGRGGQDLVDAWADGPEAYLGATVAGFPNLFMIVGPNTGLGHNSMIYMIESQLNYVMSALEQMGEQGVGSVEVRAQVQHDYNARVQVRMGSTVWLTGGCNSWYLDANGRNRTLWPGSTWRFRQLTRSFDMNDYTCRRAVGRVPARQPSGAAQ